MNIEKNESSLIVRQQKLTVNDDNSRGFELVELAQAVRPAIVLMMPLVRRQTIYVNYVRIRIRQVVDHLARVNSARAIGEHLLRRGEGTGMCVILSNAHPENFTRSTILRTKKV